MKLLLENWREYLNEEKISVEDIHKRAGELGILWDDDDKFMRWTKKITDKLHLDDLTDEERTKIYAALEKRGKEDK
jgi:phage gp16-like protein